MHLRSSVLLLAGLAAAACSLVYPVENIEGTRPGSVRDAGAESGCPGTAGPAMVLARNFCIDSTEVTNEHYAAFLDAGPDVAGLLPPSVCDFKAGNVTPETWPFATANGTLPVTDVDWCDAFAFCRWAGKRLCGAINGGSVAVDDFERIGVDQWYNACSNEGNQVFPYQGSYNPTACNGLDSNRGGPAPVGSLPTCVGGYPGLYDMSGNVFEWEDSCSATTGPDDGCAIRGGAYNYGNDGGALRCDTPGGLHRSSAFSDTGFRCCAP